MKPHDLFCFPSSWWITILLLMFSITMFVVQTRFYVKKYGRWGWLYPPGFILLVVFTAPWLMQWFCVK